MKKQTATKKRTSSGSLKTTLPYALPPHRFLEVSAESIRSRRATSLAEVKALNLERIIPDGPVHHWPDYFTVYEMTYEKTGRKMNLAFLDGKLQQKFEQLTARLDNNESVLVAQALRNLRRSPPARFSSLQSAISIATCRPTSGEDESARVLKLTDGTFEMLERVIDIVVKLKCALGPDLHIMYYDSHRVSKQNEASKRVIANLTAAVKACAQWDPPPSSHGASELYFYKLATGAVIAAPLPWIAIDVTRRFVESKLKLPKKQDVKLELIRLKMERVGLTQREKKRAEKGPINTDLGNKPTRFWSELFSSVGLSDLDRAKEYSHPRYQRAGSAKSPKLTEPLLTPTNNLRAT